jgi:hypothetical protein
LADLSLICHPRRTSNSSRYLKLLVKVQRSCGGSRYSPKDPHRTDAISLIAAATTPYPATVVPESDYGSLFNIEPPRHAPLHQLVPGSTHCRHHASSVSFLGPRDNMCWVV